MNGVFVTPSKRRKAKNRALRNYEPDPPACRNCTHFRQPQLPRKETALQPALGFIPAHCTAGSFGLPHDRGVCDDWTGADGTTLES